MIPGDFDDNAWLLIIEDGRGLGRVLGFAVYETEREARSDDIKDAFDFFTGYDVPDYVTNEIMTYADFKASYGNRMPLTNRVKEWKR